MDGISCLITGTDLVGKTTLIDSLVKTLAEDKDITSKIITNKRALTPQGSRYYSVAVELMQETVPPEELPFRKYAINYLLLKAFIEDGIHFHQPEDCILLQDSYVCRTLAVCEAEGVPYIPEAIMSLSDEFVEFDVNILLTASIDSRINRLKLRMDKIDKMDSDVLNNPMKVGIMDKALERYIRGRNNHYIIDTSNMSIPEVHDTALSIIKCQEFSIKQFRLGNYISLINV